MKEIISEVTDLSHVQLSWVTTNARAPVTLQRVHSAFLSVMCELPVLYLESRGKLINGQFLGKS